MLKATPAQIDLAVKSMVRQACRETNTVVGKDGRFMPVDDVDDPNHPGHPVTCRKRCCRRLK